MPDDFRQEYFDRAADDKAKYEEAMAAYTGKPKIPQLSVDELIQLGLITPEQYNAWLAAGSITNTNTVSS